VMGKNVFVRHLSAAVALAAICSLRGIEAQRVVIEELIGDSSSQSLSVITPSLPIHDSLEDDDDESGDPSDEDEEHDSSSSVAAPAPLSLAFSSTPYPYASALYIPKSGSQAAAAPRGIHIPFVGFTRFASTGFRDFLKTRVGQPCLIPEMLDKKSKPTGDFSKAVEWGPNPMSTTHFASSVLSLTSMGRLNATKKQMKDAKWSIHALHALFNDLMAGATSASLLERCVIGHWSPELVGEGLLKDLRDCMPNRYGEGAASLSQERELRVSVCLAVQSFIGSRLWHEVVPMQLGEEPSFGFLMADPPPRPRAKKTPVADLPISKGTDGSSNRASSKSRAATVSAADNQTRSSKRTKRVPQKAGE